MSSQHNIYDKITVIILTERGTKDGNMTEDESICTGWLDDIIQEYLDINFFTQ